VILELLRSDRDVRWPRLTNGVVAGYEDITHGLRAELIAHYRGGCSDGDVQRPSGRARRRHPGDDGYDRVR
jgi:hypothetical protein